MTGASEALIALTCHAAAPGASIVLPRPAYPAVPVLARAWGLQVREYALRPEHGFAQTAEGVLAAVDALDARGVREYASQSHRLGDARKRAAQTRRSCSRRAAFRSSSTRCTTRCITARRSPAPRSCRIPSCSATSPRRCRSPGLRIGWLIDADAERRDALAAICAATSRSRARRSPRRSARMRWRMRTRCWRGCESVARANLALLNRFMHEHRDCAGLDAAGRRHHLFPVAARRPRCAAAVRGAGEGRRARGAGRLLRHAGALPHRRRRGGRRLPGSARHLPRGARGALIPAERYDDRDSRAHSQWCCVSLAWLRRCVPMLPRAPAHASRRRRWRNASRRRCSSTRPRIARTAAQGAILFAGDSQFYRWKTIHEDLPGYTLINRGIDSFQLRDLIHYVDRLVMPYQPRLIVLHVGGNDVHNGSTPAQVLEDFKTFVALVRVKLPAVPIIYSSITPGPGRWDEAPQRVETNRVIREYIATHAGPEVHRSVGRDADCRGQAARGHLGRGSRASEPRRLSDPRADSPGHCSASPISGVPAASR